MKGKLKKSLQWSLFALIVSSLFMVFPLVYAPPVAADLLAVRNPGPDGYPAKWTAGAPGACVGTKWFNFTTDTTEPGDKFIANISVYNYNSLYTWQVKLTWNPLYLKLVGWPWRPPDNVFAAYEPVTAPDPDVHQSAGYVIWGASLSGTQNVSDTGWGVLFQAQFEVKTIPDMVQGTFSCDIGFGEGHPTYTNTFLTVLVPPPTKGTHTEEPGKYNIKWAPPTTVPCFQVHVRGPGAITPQYYRASDVGETFCVDIMVDKVAAGWNIIGFSAALMYNSSVLDFLGWCDDFATDMAANTTWLDNFCEGNETTLYVEQHDFHGVDPYLPSPSYNKIVFLAMIIPGVEGYHGTFPATGVGEKQTLVSFKFNATTQGIFPEVLSSWLNITQDEDSGRADYNPLSPMQIVNKFNTEVAHQYPPTNAYYEITAKVLGRSIDVWVGAECSPYPSPFGGQGINETADMFEPQKKVCMWAEVLYNLWPVQSKVVTFEVRTPTGETLVVLTAMTNESGIAFASFRIPWSCNMSENEEWLCGVFTVVASVDIACTVVKDWLWFHYDWRIRWKWEETWTDKGSYKHCETIHIHVEWKSKSQQVRPVCITCVLKDELQVPHGFDIWCTTVSGAEWCTYKQYYADFYIHVDKNVFAGTATIIINGLDCLPWDCGWAVVPQFEPALTVTILAEAVE